MPACQKPSTRATGELRGAPRGYGHQRHLPHWESRYLFLSGQYLFPTSGHGTSPSFSKNCSFTPHIADVCQSTTVGFHHTMLEFYMWTLRRTEDRSFLRIHWLNDINLEFSFPCCKEEALYCRRECSQCIQRETKLRSGKNHTDKTGLYFRWSYSVRPICFCQENTSDLPGLVRKLVFHPTPPSLCFFFSLPLIELVHSQPK